MGNLKAGVSYIYERSGNKIYSREFGSTERQLVGYDYNGSGQLLQEGLEKFRSEEMWKDILQSAKTNPSLQDALDRVIMIYELSKENDN